MTARVPTDPEIRARAEELGLVSPGQTPDSRTRRQVASTILEERQAAEQAAKVDAGKPPLLPVASLDVRLPNDQGVLHIDITLTPPKE